MGLGRAPGLFVLLEVIWMGRPTLYNPDKLILVEGWARDGLTNEQIAGKLGITAKTLYEWQKKYSEFRDALKKGKEVVDREVENALLKKAMGYTVEVQKAVKVRRTEYDPRTGRKVAEYEEIVPGTEEVLVPADTTAQIFWLKNRKPHEWRDRRGLEVTGEDGAPFGVVILPEAEAQVKSDTT
jgi:transposase-like protein